MKNKILILFILIITIISMIGGNALAVYATNNQALYDGGGTPIPPHTHTWSGWTCSGTGTHRRYCTGCGAQESGSHSMTWQSEGASGHRLKCTLCAYASISSTHKFGSWYATSGGCQKRCSDCGYTSTVSHSYEDRSSNYGCTTWKHCTRCGYDTTKTTTHKYGSLITVKEPTCTKAGTGKKICERCGYVKKDIAIKMLGHKWNKGVVTPPTCTVDGYTTYTCTRENYNSSTGKYVLCGATKKDNVVTKLGHDKQWSPTPNITYTTEKHWKVCVRVGCGWASTSQLDHTFATTYDVTEDTHTNRTKCTSCQYVAVSETNRHSNWPVPNGEVDEVTGTTGPANWNTDTRFHWGVCSVCTSIYHKGYHVDVNEDGYCDVCAIAIQPWVEAEPIVTCNGIIDDVTDNPDTVTFNLRSNAYADNKTVRYELYFNGSSTPFATVPTVEGGTVYGEVTTSPAINIYSTFVTDAGYKFDSVTITVNEFRANAPSTVASTSDATFEVYYIKNLTDLNKLRTNVNGGKNYKGKMLKVVNDITSSGTKTPIGNNTNKFAGTFEGLGHAITSLTVSQDANYTGLFGYIDEGAVVRNFSTGGTVKGRAYTGAIVGYNLGGTIDKVTNACSVTLYTNTYTNTKMGGICGASVGGRITNCSNSATISGHRYVGGIVGYATTQVTSNDEDESGEEVNPTYIYNCTNSGTVRGKYTSQDSTLTYIAAFGGICGYLGQGGQIIKCTNTKALARYIVNDGDPAPRMVGGIAGAIMNECLIDDCKNTATMSLTNVYYLAGICGGSWGGSIKNCTNEGALTSNQLGTAGIVGVTTSVATYERAAIVNCTNSGAISSTTYCAGIAGIGVRADYENCTNSGKVTASNTASTAGCQGGIVGRASNSTIRSCHNTNSVSGWRHVGGIAGWAANDTTLHIYDCTNTATIKGTYTNDTIDYAENDAAVGGIVGRIYSTTDAENMGIIINCINSGTINSSGAKALCQGGIAGHLFGKGIKVQGCKNSGNVAGYRAGGGIVGRGAKITVIDCENTANITNMTNTYVGGITGIGSGSLIENCINRGDITSTSASIGGISGASNVSDSYSAHLRNCINYGNVSGTQTLGGIAAQVQTGVIVENCINEGSVTGTKTDSTTGVGGMVGKIVEAQSNVTIKNCVNKGPITGYNQVGGILGQGDGTNINISYCVNEATASIYNKSNVSENYSKANVLTTATPTGGIAGLLDSGKVLYCENKAEVKGGGTTSSKRGVGVAGIVGIHYEGDTKYCTNSGRVYNAYFYVAGIVGRQEGGITSQITHCHNTGDVTGAYANVAGVAGSTTQDLAVKYCTNTGTITCSKARVGGIVGYFGGSTTGDYVIGCINSGDVIGGNADGDYFGIGGIVAQSLAASSNTASVTNLMECFNYGNISGPYKVGGIVGTAQYGTTHFTSCYNYGTINNISGTNTGYAAGIVGYKSVEGDLEDCNNYGDVTGSYQYHGGVVGYNIAGRMNICRNSGNITGTTYTGGVAGRARVMSQCLNTGNVSNTTGNYCGGIAGYSSTIGESANKGDVSGYSYVGGVVGCTDTSLACVINKCFNLGDVSGKEACIGGIVGALSSTHIIENVYNRGAVTRVIGGSTATGTNYYPGGIVGVIKGSLRYCYNAGLVTNNGVVNNVAQTERKGAVIGTQSSGTVEHAYYEQGTATVPIYSQGGTDTPIVKTHAEITADSMAPLLNVDQDPVVWTRDDSENDGYPYFGVLIPTPFEGTITLEDCEYDGTVHEPTPVVIQNGVVQLVPGKDYTILRYEDNQDAGTASVYVQFQGALSGTAIGHFEIKQRKLTIDTHTLFKTYVEGNPLPDPSGDIEYFVTGLVPGEVPGLNSGYVFNGDKILGPLNRQEGEAIGIYNILYEPMGLSDNLPFKMENYDIELKGKFKIKSGSGLMERERPTDEEDGQEIELDESYMIGAYREGLDQYTSDKVVAITILDNMNIPTEGVVASWDVSYDYDDSIYAWIILEGSGYHLYIGGHGAIFAPANSRNLFGKYVNCTSIEGLENLDTSDTTDMREIFANNEKLTSINLSGLDTSNVVDMSGMFKNDWALESLDLSTLNTNSAMDMSEMFKYCTSLTSLDLSTFNTNNVLAMNNMFEGASKITELDLRTFNTQNVAYMDEMFKDMYISNGTTTSGLELLVLGTNFTTINGENIFAGDNDLQRILAQRATPMALSEHPGVTDRNILYVQNPTVETSYESATNYASTFTTDRVRPMMEPVGDLEINMKVLDFYNDPGLYIAGYDLTGASKALPANLTKYGYRLDYVSTVDRNNAGTYGVTYNLYLNGTLIDTFSRVVNVINDSHKPSGTLTIQGATTINGKKYTSSSVVSLAITASDDMTATQDLLIAIFNENEVPTVVSDDKYMPFTSTVVGWQLSPGDGEKTVYLIVKDEAGNTTEKWEKVDVESGG